ncbi:IclR family transcriptional regulator [Epibacterium ulvae]|uniref:Transcriptional regulator, IclR family n=1 Tax=Epibacterium ulvae TaxID=1156985 RepID=A0A1G5RC26_9RHOB|nr:IclR family transcriptional regulator [Epibacterium ulvae]SCZ70951.1 transcriptional regulator, IclR family [Epibacterium ulvae]
MADDGLTKRQGQIPTNLRLLLVIEEVAKRGVAVKPSDMVESLGLPKATIHRLLHTCETEGFLQRDLDGRAYGPGPRLRKLAADTMSSEHLRTARLTVLKAVAEELGETCNLATPDREGMIYLDRVETHWPLRIQMPIGTQVPFHCTASGKMYLSTLRPNTLEAILNVRTLKAHTDRSETNPAALMQEIETTRIRGYATDDQEFIDGMCAVAVPVLDTQGRLMATLSVHTPVQRHTLQDVIQFLPMLKTAARQLQKLN